MSRSISYLIRAVSVCVLFAGTAAHAMTVSKLSDDAFAPLRQANVRRKVTINVALEGRRKSAIELEQFDVWTPDGKVIIHSDQGVREEAPPVRVFYRGLVDRDPESFAVFSVDPSDQAIEALINAGGRKYAVNGRLAHNRRPGPNRFDDFLTATDEQEQMPDEIRTWTCAVDKLHLPPDVHATGIGGAPVKVNGISGTQKYAMTVEIETDFELFQNAGSVAANVTNYVTGLTAAISTIYSRDLSTVVFQKAVNVYTSAADPWTAVANPDGDPGAGLDELVAYYHSVSKPGGRTTTSVVMLSGKDVPAGVAYEGQICNSTGNDGGVSPNFFGPYAWCGGIGRIFGLTDFAPVPDPNNPGPPLYAMPPERNLGGGNFSVQSYWPLEEYAHEMGHNMGGHHTHCVAITAGEFNSSGFMDSGGTTSSQGTSALPGNFVDHCYGHENFAGDNTCFGGASGSADYILGSQGVFKGTIMSYCHNVFIVSGSTITPQSRFTFGQAVEPSHHELDDFMLRAAGPTSTPSSGPRNIVSGTAAFTISTITAPATVVANSTGNLASITPITGTYTWTITNGSITAGQGTNQITFTAGASGTTTVTIAAYATSKCGITDSKAMAITTGLTAPTNVTATFDGVSGVSLNWTVAPGAAKYNIYRSSPTDYQSFTKLVTSPTTPPFTDTGVSLGNAYLYKIRSTDAGGVTESSDSNADVATTVIYTNVTLTASTSLIRAADMTDLRSAADKVRILAKLGAPGYTNPTITAGTSKVDTDDMNEVRSVIGSSLATMGLPGISFSSNPITVNTTKINAVDFNELRNGIR